MRRIAHLVLAAALALAACGVEQGSTEITPDLLEDPAAVQRVANRLEPAEREAFSRYVAGRSMITAMGGKPLVNSEGNDPATVSEAIALQQWYDGITAELTAAQAPHSAVIMRGMEGATFEEYNAAVAGSNAAADVYRQKLEAGPPPGLGRAAD